MDTNLYQNIDTPQTNPLEPTQNTKEAATQKTNATKINPKDPKILILIILGIVFVILLVVSIVVTLLRKANPNLKSKPIELPNNTVLTPSPTVSQSRIPTQYQEQFDQIQKDIQTSEDFDPPPIDIEIGL